jgi:dCTP diphosphatase
VLDVETKWLAYARAVSTDGDHLKQCVAAGGARPIQPAPYAQLRWPGYIGNQYARILCLGMVHNGDMLYAGRSSTETVRTTEGDLNKSLIGLEPTYLDWLAGNVTPDIYLEKTRDVYAEALTFWDPWKRLAPILKAFGFKTDSEQVSAIAYSNIAKCWSDTADKKRKDKRVMKCCNEWASGSTSALINAIRPVCILTATLDPGFSPSTLPILEDGKQPDVWSFHYLHGTIELNGRRLLRDEWAPLAAERYSKRLQAISTHTSNTVAIEETAATSKVIAGFLDIEALAERLRTFAHDRDWEQFHSPKNLASALVVEASELLEQFQWLTDEQSRRIAENDAAIGRVAEELADVLIYAIRLSDILGLSLPSAIEEKIEVNSKKYPIEKSKGSAKKYSDF